MARSKGSKNGEQKTRLHCKVPEEVAIVIKNAAAQERISEYAFVALILEKWVATKKNVRHLKGEARMLADHAKAKIIKQKMQRIKDIASIDLTRALLPANILRPIFTSLLLTHTVDKRLITSQKKAYEQFAIQLKCDRYDRERMRTFFKFLMDDASRRGFIDKYERNMRLQHENLLKANKHDEAMAILTRASDKHMREVLTEQEQKRIGITPPKDPLIPEGV